MDGDFAASDNIPLKWELLDVYKKDPGTILQVFSYLTDEDKIELLDLFPRIRPMVRMLKIKSKAEADIAKYAAILMKCQNIETVVGGWHVDLLKIPQIKNAITSGNNRNFKRFVGRDGLRVSLDYIKKMVFLDPTYDGRHLEIVHTRWHRPESLFATHPHLKFKMIVSSLNFRPDPFDNFIGKYSERICEVKEKDGFAITTELPLVTSASFITRSGLIDNLNMFKNLKSILLEFVFDPTDSELREKLLSFPNLVDLGVSPDSYNTESINAFVDLLDRSRIKHIRNVDGIKWYLPRIIIRCHRNNFEGLTDRGLNVDKGVLTITQSWHPTCRDCTNDIYVPLLDLITKFKRIRKVVIVSDDDSFINKIKEQFTQIVADMNLPRNRALTLIVKNIELDKKGRHVHPPINYRNFVPALSE